MITTLYRQGHPEHAATLDEVFDYIIRFQVLVDTEEHLDYLTALQLMYGREIQVDTWAGWHEQKDALKSTRGMELKLLPIWFSTTPITITEI